MDPKRAEELVGRLGGALRGGELYSPNHPLVQRGLDALAAAAADAPSVAPAVVIGFIGDEVVVNSLRLPRGTAALVGFARHVGHRQIDKTTFSKGLTPSEVRAPGS